MRKLLFRACKTKTELRCLSAQWIAVMSRKCDDEFMEDVYA